MASSQPAYQYRSLIPGPEIHITSSSGDTVKSSKGGIHPNTSYDQGPASGAPSVVDSDDSSSDDDDAPQGGAKQLASILFGTMAPPRPLSAMDNKVIMIITALAAVQ